MKRMASSIFLVAWFFLLVPGLGLASGDAGTPLANQTHSANYNAVTNSSQAGLMSETAKNNLVTNEIKEKMMNWSRQLGVTCIYCHNLENFKEDKKLSFKISLKHDKMVRVLQEEVFDERDNAHALKVKVDCYMCHRGQQRPDYQEPPNKLLK